MVLQTILNRFTFLDFKNRKILPDAGASGVDTIPVVEGAIARSRAKEIQRDFTKFVTCTIKKALDPDETKMEMDESHVILVSNSSY